MTTAPVAGPPARGLSDTQLDVLLRPINPHRVQNLRGQSHLQAWDVRRCMIRIFGFDGWATETLELTLVREMEHAPGTVQVARWTNGQRHTEPNERTLWTVIYRVQARLTIRAPGGQVIAGPFDDAAVGDSCHQPSLGDAHDHAVKTALSQALKRCAVNLGDQFGLGLYNGGRNDAVVRWTLASQQAVDTASTPEAAAGDDDTVLPEPEDAAPVSAPPAAAGPADPVAHAISRLDSALAGAAAARQDTTQPGEVAAPGALPMVDGQKRRMFALFHALGHANDRDIQVAFMEWALGRPVPHRDDLTGPEANTIIAALEDRQRKLAQTQPASA